MKSKNNISWGVGFLVLTAVGVIVIPPLMKKYSNKLYKALNKNEKIDFDNLGPEIVKKDDVKEN